MTDTAETMNGFVQEKLKSLRKIGRPKPGKVPPRKFFVADAHWVPQADYVFNTNSEQHERLVKHVLHSENLNQEFASLMETYQLNVSLSAAAKTYDRTKFHPKCTVADFTSETRELIEDVYAADFELGGYTMIERSRKVAM